MALRINTDAVVVEAGRSQCVIQPDLVTEADGTIVKYMTLTKLDRQLAKVMGLNMSKSGPWKGNCFIERMTELRNEQVTALLAGKLADDDEMKDEGVEVQINKSTRVKMLTDMHNERKLPASVDVTVSFATNDGTHSRVHQRTMKVTTAINQNLAVKVELTEENLNFIKFGVKNMSEDHVGRDCEGPCVLADGLKWRKRGSGWIIVGWRKRLTGVTTTWCRVRKSVPLKSSAELQVLQARCTEQEVLRMIEGANGDDDADDDEDGDDDHDGGSGEDCSGEDGDKNADDAASKEGVDEDVTERVTNTQPPAHTTTPPAAVVSADSSPAASRAASKPKQPSTAMSARSRPASKSLHTFFSRAS